MPEPVADPKLTEFAHTSMPFTALIGAELVSLDPDEVVGRLAWAPERCTSGEVMHGGAIMALADSVGALVAYLNLPETAQATTTTSSTTQFLRAVRGGNAIATARPLHKGRQSIVVETDVRDDEGRLVARVTQSQAVLH
jgi:uncharacterized protein (TIGR00369 family)